MLIGYLHCSTSLWFVYSFALFDLITCYRYKLNKLDKINDEKEYNKLLKILMNSIKEFERIKIEEYRRWLT